MNVKSKWPLELGRISSVVDAALSSFTSVKTWAFGPWSTELFGGSQLFGRFTCRAVPPRIAPGEFSQTTAVSLSTRLLR